MAALGLGLAPWMSGAAWACATCQDPNPARTAVYLDMTVFLSLVPLLAMGGGMWWIRQRLLSAEPRRR